MFGIFGKKKAELIISRDEDEIDKGYQIRCPLCNKNVDVLAREISYNCPSCDEVFKLKVIRI